GEDSAAERGDGDLRVAVTQRGGQGLEQCRRDRLDRAARCGQQGLEVRGLQVLVLRQAYVDDPLVDPRVDRDRGRRPVGSLATEDLEGGLVERRRDLHGDRLG